MSDVPTPASLLSSLQSYFDSSPTSTLALTLSLATLTLAIVRVLTRRTSVTASPAPSSVMPPSESRAVTHSELSSSKGVDGGPIYIAVKDPYSSQVTVFDMTSATDFYGPGAGYHMFAGRDATYGLATTCLDPSKLDGDVASLTETQKDTLVQWYTKYTSKYPIVGHLVPDSHSEDDDKKDL